MAFQALPVILHGFSEAVNKKETFLRVRLGRILPAYGAALALTMVLSWTWTALTFPPPYWNALVLGWILAMLNAAAGLLVKRIGARRSLGWFLFWSIGMSGIRLLILLIIIVAVHRGDVANFPPFMISFFTGFFSCMACEVMLLHRSTSGKQGSL